MAGTNTGLASFGRPVDEAYFSVALVSSNPTIPTTSSAELTGYETVRVSDSGITPAVDLGKEDPVQDWAGKDVLSSPSNPSATLEVPIIDNSNAAKRLKYGASKVDENGNAVFDGSTDVWVVIIDELRNDANGDPASIVRTIYPNCVPQSIDLGTHSRSELIIDTVTFQALYDSSIGGYFKELAPVAVGD
jgi:hypothetical protein